MSTLDLYNVNKARFWNELLAKEQLQSKKAIYAVNHVRAQTAGQRRDPKELGAAEMNKWRSMAIPKVTGTKYQQLKDKYRPQTAPPKSRGGDTSLEFGTDPRFSSQVGYQLFGFSDWNRAPVTEAKKSSEYESLSQMNEALRLHDRKVYHPYQKFSKPVLESHNVGWKAFDSDYYNNRRQNRALIHPLKSSDMTKFAASMIASGRKG